MTNSNGITRNCSKGSVNIMSPKSSLQYCATLACCLGLQWFSNDKINGNSVVLKAYSAIAAMTSCKLANINFHRVFMEGKKNQAKIAKFCDTFARISGTRVYPCTMTGSSSLVLPSHKSNSMHLQPASSTWRYISTEDLPVHWWPNIVNIVVFLMSSLIYHIATTCQ